MQRTIKFRAWDKTLNKIHCWSAIENHFTFEELLDDNFFEAMQYTGINGNGNEEIYDDDIIRLWERSPNGNESTYILKVYQKENGTWMAEGLPEDDKLYGTYRTRIELYSYRQQVDVIGNKYENPELLR